MGKKKKKKDAAGLPYMILLKQSTASSIIDARFLKMSREDAEKAAKEASVFCHRVCLMEARMLTNYGPHECP